MKHPSNLKLDKSEVSVAEKDALHINPQLLTLTRYLFLNRIVEETDLKNTYCKIYDEDEDATDMQTVLNEISESLESSKMKVTSGRCEITNKQYYLVVPTHFRPAHVWPNAVFSEQELNFVKGVLHEIIVSNVGVISKDRIIKKLSRANVTTLLKTLIEQKYLLEPKKEKYTLSVLAINELEPYINYAYKDTLKKCIFCKRVIFFGGRCSNCQGSSHFTCLKTFQESMKQAIKCPSCNKPWNSYYRSFEEILDQEEEFEEDE